MIASLNIRRLIRKILLIILSEKFFHFLNITYKNRVSRSNSPSKCESQSSIPKEFLYLDYISTYPDLDGMNEIDAFKHFESYGKAEGRSGNFIRTRLDFIQLAKNTSGITLEIGPFYSPLLSGENAKYADVLDQKALRKRAKKVGGDPLSVPIIDWVLTNGELLNPPFEFENCLSSHVIEHQPDIIGHLKQVYDLLPSGGRYFLLIPDRRYCFDHYMSNSPIGEMIQAYIEKRKFHPLRSLIEHRVLQSHNDSNKHWNGVHGGRKANKKALANVLKEFDSSKNQYIDVHSWYFDPNAFRATIEILQNLNLISFQIEALYETRKYTNEFWVILKKLV